MLQTAAGERADWGFLTVLATDATPGLQIRHGRTLRMRVCNLEHQGCSKLLQANARTGAS